MEAVRPVIYRRCLPRSAQDAHLVGRMPVTMSALEYDEQQLSRLTCPWSISSDQSGKGSKPSPSHMKSRESIWKNGSSSKACGACDCSDKTRGAMDPLASPSYRGPYCCVMFPCKTCGGSSSAVKGKSSPVWYRTTTEYTIDWRRQSQRTEKQRGSTRGARGAREDTTCSTDLTSL